MIINIKNRVNINAIFTMAILALEEIKNQKGFPEFIINTNSTEGNIFGTPLSDHKLGYYSNSIESLKELAENKKLMRIANISKEINSVSVYVETLCAFGKTKIGGEDSLAKDMLHKYKDIISAMFYGSIDHSVFFTIKLIRDIENIHVTDEELIYYFGYNVAHIDNFILGALDKEQREETGDWVSSSLLPISLVVAFKSLQEDKLLREISDDFTISFNAFPSMTQSIGYCSFYVSEFLEYNKIYIEEIFGSIEKLEKIIELVKEAGVIETGKSGKAVLSSINIAIENNKISDAIDKLALVLISLTKGMTYDKK